MNYAAAVNAYGMATMCIGGGQGISIIIDQNYSGQTSA
ncbi:MAG: hypothetical protein CM15mP95_3000 [Alphaproteobacteria bacterium]|nr:MAG: hypothetical protein CM15mP95_3000 [Alphaproteobacteria bacterium]